MTDTFGSRLRIAIEQSGKSMHELGSEIGNDGCYISNLCAGRKSPALKVVGRLLVALPRVDARWLVCGDK